jgi:hypothetical protein
MAELIIFGDLEAALVEYLSDTLEAYYADLEDDPVVPSVSVTIPPQRPAEFVIVPRIGGSRRDLVTDSVTIGLEAWAQTPSAALVLCQLVRGAIFALPGQTISGLTVYRVQELVGPRLAADPDSGIPRYLTAVTIDARYERAEGV